ncbi:MAG: glycoside hydrolase family 30 protein [Solirubrobacteraceae bacterium]
MTGAAALALAGLLGLAGPSGFATVALAKSRTTHVEVVQTTSDLSERLTRLPGAEFGAAPSPGLPVIDVDETVRYQRVAGFGAAMTDSSAWLLYEKLSPRTRTAVMRRLFGTGGIRLSYVRLPMGATDFTRDGRPYTYDDLRRGRSDPRLSRFSISHDRAYIIPALRQMLAIDRHVEILATPWSPPAWMKTNHRLNNDANGGMLKRSAYRPLARYFVKFIQAYARRRIPIAAITPQNEPGQQTSYPGLNWPEPSEARWIVNDLRPALSAAGLQPRIYGLDFSWVAAPYAQSLISSAPAARTIAGVAWHCYVGDPTAMTMLHELAPQLQQIETECSSGIAPAPVAELVIASMRNWASTVLLWNLALDPDGGPVQRPNAGCRHCTGVVTVHERTRTASYGRDYYQLGQASRFIQRGARRIHSDTFVSYLFRVDGQGNDYASAGVDDVAFENPNGSKVLLAYNNTQTAQSFAVEWHRRSFPYTLPPGATVTFVWGKHRPGPGRGGRRVVVRRGRGVVVR